MSPSLRCLHKVVPPGHVFHNLVTKTLLRIAFQLRASRPDRNPSVIIGSGGFSDTRCLGIVSSQEACIVVILRLNVRTCLIQNAL